MLKVHFSLSQTKRTKWAMTMLTLSTLQKFVNTSPALTLAYPSTLSTSSPSLPSLLTNNGPARNGPQTRGTGIIGTHNPHPPHDPSPPRDLHLTGHQANPRPGQRRVAPRPQLRPAAAIQAFRQELLHEGGRRRCRLHPRGHRRVRPARIQQYRAARDGGWGEACHEL